MNAALRPLLVAIAVALPQALLVAQARDAEAIVSDYDEVVYPAMSEGTDPASLARFDQQVREAAQTQQACALELFRGQPDHARVPELMRRRWTLFCTVQKSAAPVLAETANLGPHPSADLVRAAAGARALAASSVMRGDFDERAAIVRAALVAAPGDVQVGNAVMALMKYATASAARQKALLDLLGPQFAGDQEMIRETTPLRRLCDIIGKRVDLVLPREPSPADPDTKRDRTSTVAGPCIVTFTLDTCDYFSETDQADTAALRRINRLFKADTLPVITVLSISKDQPATDVLTKFQQHGRNSRVYLDRAEFEQSFPRAKFGLAESPLHLLIDQAGRVAAWTFRAANLLPEVDRLNIPRRSKSL